MKMKQCPNGHFYDQIKDQTCPYCKNLAPAAGTQEERRGAKTVGIMQAGDGPVPAQATGAGTQEERRGSKTVGIMQAGAGPVPAQAPAPQAEAGKAREPAEKSGGHTVAIIAQKLGVDPVVGWLVCVEGKDKGRDFRIHADNNFIGRDEQMDIALTSDETISRRNHAVISFDSQTGIFYFSPDEGRSITRHNGNPIFSTVELSPKDELEIGTTKLLFVPLCGKDFCWE